MNLDRVVDATTARLMLRHLAARGFHAAYLTQRVGMARNGIIAIRSGQRRTIHPYTERAITRLHAELRDADPADYGITPRSAKRTRSLPARRGWTRGAAA